MRSFTMCVMATVATAFEGMAPLDLGSAGSYAVLSAAATTAAGMTEVQGNFGQSPGTAVTATAGVQFLEEYNVYPNPLAVQAQADLALAREDAASREGEFNINGVLGGMTLVPGVYDSVAALGLTGVLTFDAGEEGEDAVWIIRSPAALTTAAASSMVMTNGGCAGNVFFVVGAAATLGGASTGIGNILAYAAVTGGAGANIGPVFSSTAAITLSNNKVTLTSCAPTPTPAPVTDEIPRWRLEGDEATTNDSTLATENNSCGSITCLSMAAILIGAVVVIFGGVMYMRFRNSDKSTSAPAVADVEEVEIAALEV